MRRYTLVTGYYENPSNAQWNREFLGHWMKNNRKNLQPIDTIIINAGAEPEHLQQFPDSQRLNLKYNIGHVHNLDVGMEFQSKYCGFTVASFLGALVSYHNNSDYLFIEQDCLVFGNVIDVMYETMDKENTDMIVGNPAHAKGQAIEQSLTLMRRDVLLTFINEYCRIPDHDAGKNGLYKRPEQKWKEIINHHIRSSYLPFGYGRDRPETFHKNETFYVQQITPHMLEEMAPLLY